MNCCFRAYGGIRHRLFAVAVVIAQRAYGNRWR